jgi:ribulose-5-phosphate 4-epimerase/fuculose-1-phosphate aldolase
MSSDAPLLRDQVAWACRILALEGYVDLTLGHVSARDSGESLVWIKRRGVALDEVEPDDVIALGLDDKTAFELPEMHAEAVLHTEVYKARPDVGAVVHGHPPYATALGAADAPLELITHDAVLFADGLGRFEETAELITASEQGAAVASALGAARAVVMRNHGVLVVGKDVPWAVLGAVTLERAARLQAIASSFGGLLPMSREHALEVQPDKYHDRLVDEYWASWQRKLHRLGLGFESLAAD